MIIKKKIKRFSEGEHGRERRERELFNGDREKKKRYLKSQR